MPFDGFEKLVGCLSEISGPAFLHCSYDACGFIWMVISYYDGVGYGYLTITLKSSLCAAYAGGSAFFFCNQMLTQS
ncbi:hypothetical protein SLEP1_g11279 [Rubroshorea leprosula]|uniref:Uncharacterized protein n=1 Tax=Rubroshorea leprosula TaxID=152421 RepID=A0AAV5IAU6_9ROSI|nr:hypothetical protein SLEP1_g11279 [Rubroshorea leprosula]